MARTRAAVLRAAAECIERHGVRRTTMVDVASRSGVAKATLYNHFRTKDDVLAALVEAQVVALVAACADVATRRPDPAGPVDRAGSAGSAAALAAALTHAAVALSGSPALRRVAADEPALLAALCVPGDGRTWQAAREGVVGVLRATGAAQDPPAVELVLRWLTAHLAWPATPDRALAEAALLATGLSSDAAITASASRQD